jgi:hypothetical protein
MSDETNNITRRRALKIIGVGVGAAGSLPVLNNTVLGQQHQQHQHPQAGGQAGVAKTPAADKAKTQTPKFFTPAELAIVATMADLIIPTDDHSPGARAAETEYFIDLMISESPAETKTLWRDGLAAVEKMSREKFSVGFDAATEEQRTKLLTDISKDERKPNTVEERFWVAIKNLTIDGYYTSEIGIHQDLQYNGNSFVKEFKGCTHPEHQA